MIYIKGLRSHLSNVESCICVNGTCFLVYNCHFTCIHGVICSIFVMRERKREGGREGERDWLVVEDDVLCTYTTMTPEHHLWLLQKRKGERERGREREREREREGRGEGRKGKGKERK